VFLLLAYIFHNVPCSHNPLWYFSLTTMLIENFFTHHSLPEEEGVRAITRDSERGHAWMGPLLG